MKTLLITVAALIILAIVGYLLLLDWAINEADKRERSQERDGLVIGDDVDLQEPKQREGDQ